MLAAMIASGRAQAVHSRTLSVLGASRAEVYSYKTHDDDEASLYISPYLPTRLSLLSVVFILHTSNLSPR